MPDEPGQPRVLPTDDYEDYQRRVHYTTELLWVLGAGQQVLVALHALLAGHNADLTHSPDAAVSPSER